MNPVIKNGEVRISRAATRPKHKGDVRVIFGNLTHRFFIAETIPKDDVRLLILGYFTQDYFHVARIPNIVLIFIGNLTILLSLVQCSVNYTVPGFFNRGSVSA